MKSMTGFGRGAITKDNFSVTVDIKTVNNRFLDVNIRIPGEFQAIESLIKRAVTSRLHRGRVDVSVAIDRTGEAELEVNKAIVGAYLAAIRDIQNEFGISGEPDVNAVFRLPNVFSTKRQEIGDELQDATMAAMVEALTELERMRATEGSMLKEDIEARLATIDGSVSEIMELAPTVVEEFRERISKRISEMVEKTGTTGEIDPARMAQEVAYLSDRSDISEETSRIQAHIRQYRKLMSESGELGKKLDFLTQELNREANTITSKTGNMQIKERALLIKSEIEKIREQIQNVE